MVINSIIIIYSFLDSGQRGKMQIAKHTCNSIYFYVRDYEYTCVVNCQEEVVLIVFLRTITKEFYNIFLNVM